MKTFLLIEDDDIFNFIHNQVILQALPDAKITLKEYHPNFPDFIFLDLNMPEMNGFDFIDSLIAHFGEDCISSQLYLVSSTLDHRDKDRAKSYNCVKGLIDKPLTTSFINALLN
jgi:CheY-like chemotaxis protein